ncbi:MAG: MBL fold metallo-hydrolase [Verrucomicrobia bacterium]|nr:MBL fold metallo-hydrolase [Verrucomicrobiota bacterium]
MIGPALHDSAFLANVRAAHHGHGHFHLWWLGQSGFLLQWQKRHALLDPYLSDSLTAKYAGTNKPHVRMTARVIAPERLDFIDVVTSSHNHTDHFDPDTLLPLFAANPKLHLLVPEANRGVAAYRLKLSPKSTALMGINAGDIRARGGFRFHGIPAAHNELEQDADLNHKFLGYVVEFGSWRIYHAGDTKLYRGIEDWVRPFRVDVALLPINGDRPERKVAGNLDAREAARLAKDIGARLAVPMHYDMFTFNTADPAAFVDECAKIGQPCRVLKAGERWSSAELG